MNENRKPVEDNMREVTNTDELDGEWLDLTPIDQASRGIIVKVNSMSGEVVLQRKLIEVEPIADESGQLWRQFEIVKG